MTQQDRHGWWVVAALAVVSFLLLGSTIGTVGVFFHPLIQSFGWSHAQVSRLATAFLLCMGLSAWTAGWMLDRMPAQVPMGLGALAAGTGYFLASRCQSLGSLTATFALIGAGVGSSTIVPVTIVASNWFPNRRGLAIGVGISGSPMATLTIPPLLTHVILVHGWRVGMIWLGVPIFVIGLPAIAFVVRTRPAGVPAPKASRETTAVAGLDLSQALRAPPFWMLAGVQILFTIAYNGVYYHLVAFLIDVGYSPQTAAVIFGAKSIFVIFGTIFLGGLGDRVGARRVLAFAMLALCLSLVALLEVSSPMLGLAALMLFTVGYGTPTGATSTLVPMLLVESLGMRRFPALMGIIGLVATVASAVGPLFTGRIFDLTRSYSVPFALCAVLFALGAFITTTVYPAPGHDLVPLAAGGVPTPAMATNRGSP
jgi:MFS family permease